MEARRGKIELFHKSSSSLNTVSPTICYGMLSVDILNNKFTLICSFSDGGQHGTQVGCSTTLHFITKNFVPDLWEMTLRGRER